MMSFKTGWKEKVFAIVLGIVFLFGLLSTVFNDVMAASGNYGMNENVTKTGNMTVSDDSEQCDVQMQETEEDDTFVFEDTNPYILTGDMAEGSTNGWYTSEVTISAPEGYLISYDNSLTDEEWNETIIYCEEGVHSFPVYLKEKSSGRITDAIEVTDLKIDQTDPVNLEISYEENVIGKIKEAFGFYNNPVKVTISADDSISGIEAFTYKYETNTLSLSGQGKDETIVTVTDEEFVKNEDGSASYTFEIPAQFRGNVSFTATDVSGRTKECFDTNTIVVDDKNPDVKISYQAAGKNSVTGETASLKEKVERDRDVISRDSVTDADENTRFIYNGAVTALIEIEEANFFADDISVSMKRDGIELTQEEKNTCISEWKIDEENDRESCEVTLSEDGDYEITVIYADKSGNDMFYSSDEFQDKSGHKIYTSNVITVDTIKPVIDVSYSGGSARNTNYYNVDRTATIKITDRNFRPNEVAADISAVDVQGREVTFQHSDLTSWGDWTQDTEDENLWIATIPFHMDSVYTFDIAYVDLAGNQADDYAADSFVVDRVAPTRIVSYSPAKQVVDASTLLKKSSYIYEEESTNSILYYDGDVTATFKITEANFYPEDVVIKVNGVRQEPSDWKQSGDEWTGTIILSGDGDYQVTMDYTDHSANSMKSYASEKIVIDTTKPTISVSNIRANSANKDEKYGFTITASDTADNLDAETFKPVLTAVTRSRNGSYEVKEVPLGDISTVESNQTYSVSVDNLTEDAVYTLSCEVKDRSDNEYKMMTLEDGREYETVSFSINRNGSVFIADESTEYLVEQYYVYSVQNDIVISEINVDPVENYTVKLNGTDLKEGKDYTTSVSNRDGEWSMRTYDVKKSLFKEEGDYVIVIESVDKAETAAYSDVKNLKISCVVDQTAPTVTISGLKENGRYQTKEQIVTAIPTDDGGKLRSFKAVAFDKNGEPLRNEAGEDISTRVELEQDDLDMYLAENDGRVMFTVPEGMENQVRIICDDYALYPDGVNTNKYDETFSGVTVSSPKLTVINADDSKSDKTILGIIAAAAGIVIALLIVRRKQHIRQGMPRPGKQRTDCE